LRTKSGGSKPPPYNESRQILHLSAFAGDSRIATTVTSFLKYYAEGKDGFTALPTRFVRKETDSHNSWHLYFVYIPHEKDGAR